MPQGYGSFQLEIRTPYFRSAVSCSFSAVQLYPRALALCGGDVGPNWIMFVLQLFLRWSKNHSVHQNVSMCEPGCDWVTMDWIGYLRLWQLANKVWLAFTFVFQCQSNRVWSPAPTVLKSPTPHMHVSSLIYPCCLHRGTQCLYNSEKILHRFVFEGWLTFIIVAECKILYRIHYRSCSVYISTHSLWFRFNVASDENNILVTLISF